MKWSTRLLYWKVYYGVNLQMRWDLSFTWYSFITYILLTTTAPCLVNNILTNHDDKSWNVSDIEVWKGCIKTLSNKWLCWNVYYSPLLYFWSKIQFLCDKHIKVLRVGRSWKHSLMHFCPINVGLEMYIIHNYHIMFSQKRIPCVIKNHKIFHGNGCMENVVLKFFVPQICVLKCLLFTIIP